MDFSSICRTCLGTSGLNPIFLNEQDHEFYSTSIFITSGVKIEINDGLPQKMCMDCISTINNTLKFRKNCKKTELHLMKIKEGLESNETTITSNEHNMLEAKITNNKHNLLEVEITDNNNKHTMIVKRENDESDISEDDIPLKYLGDEDKCLDMVDLTMDKKKHDLDIKKEKYMNNNITDIKVEEKKLQSEITDTSEEHTESLLKHVPENIEFTITETKRKKQKRNGNIHEVLYEKVYNPNSRTQRVTCKLCLKELSIRSIDIHMARTHPGADKRKAKCDLCDSYVLKQMMARHLTKKHGSCCLRCGYCKMDFSSREVLIEHKENCSFKKTKRKVSESGREMMECDVCHKMMQRASLRMHKAIKHAGLGPVCEHCGKRFGNKFRLNEHYRAKHGYEKFKCSYCDFQSAGVMALRNHERRHRGEKPFVCESCGAKFHAAYLLAQHKQSHRTEKTLKCDLCPSTFKANNSLHMHKLTCHSSSLFKCNMCPRAYSCRHYAVKHMRHVHGYRGRVPQLQKIDATIENS